MKSILLVSILFLSFLPISLFGQSKLEYNLLIGTFADKTKPNGIHVFTFNASNGSLTRKQPMYELENASYLAISTDRKNVYVSAWDKISSFSFDPKSGILSLLNEVPSDGTCYVSVDENKQTVFVADYSGGRTIAIPLHSDGSFVQDRVQTIQHIGSSIVKPRQNNPLVHATVLSPDEKYLLVPDLGTDKVVQYAYDPNEKEALKKAKVPYVITKPGGGPRHLTFHPNGKFAYLVLEMLSQVTVFDYHEGNLTEKQTISMVDENFVGKLSGADIHVSSDGKFLYASNREASNEIVIFAIDSEGKLDLIAKESSLGIRPRNFAIDPTGNFVLVANRYSNEVVVFKRDKVTGLLSPTGERIKVDVPVCLKFTKI